MDLNLYLNKFPFLANSHMLLLDILKYLPTNILNSLSVHTDVCHYTFHLPIFVLLETDRQLSLYQTSRHSPGCILQTIFWAYGIYDVVCLLFNLEHKKMAIPADNINLWFTIIILLNTCISDLFPYILKRHSPL